MNFYDKDEPITGADREWFLYEDQTIGLGTIADLVIQGKSKNEIKNLIQNAKNSGYSHAYDPGVFELSYNFDSPYVDKFIDECINIAKKK